MEQVLYWGIDVIKAIQTIANPVLTVIMKALTSMGTEYFFILVLPILFWCFDEKKCCRIGLFFFFQAFLNSWLKLILNVPRPFTLDPSIKMAHEPSLSMPSGHSQNTAAFWGLTAPIIKKPWGLILAIVVPLLIGLTRMYLGVHYPTDVASGLLLGWITALIAYFFGDKIASIVSKWNVRVQIIVACVIALGMNFILPSDPSMAGCFLGSSIGMIFLIKKLRFDGKSGTKKQKILRYLLGLVTLVIVYLLGKVIAPKSGQANYELFKFIRYAVVTAWAVLGAPWLFLKLKLASKHE